MEVVMPEHGPECDPVAPLPSSPSGCDQAGAPSVPSVPSALQSDAECYGELVILGYNGSLTSGEKGRRRSKLVLYKRPVANGVKPARYYEVKQQQMSQCPAVLDRRQHSISYTLSRHKAVIVEYSEDPNTDMFQLGRSSEQPIDFILLDTIPGVKSAEDTRDTKFAMSTISRFACRILVNRRTHRATVYAAGFDSSRNIFLGEKATKWETDGIIDGLTTNGVLLMHSHSWPLATASSASPASSAPASSSAASAAAGAGDTAAGRLASERKQPLWTEVSVGGGIYGLRATRSASLKGPKIACECGELRDGSLLDLCGATLLWRSAAGLTQSPSRRELELMVDQLNAGRPQCPVGLNTLVIPRKSSLSGGARAREAAGAAGLYGGGGTVAEREPWVYLNCGHVQGRHQWGCERGTNSRTCPICISVGPVVRLCMGMEPSFHVNRQPPSHAFNPCGHMASEATVSYWSSVQIPHGTNGFHAMCPFCATPLATSGGATTGGSGGGHSSYVRLIFQDNLD